MEEQLNVEFHYNSMTDLLTCHLPDRLRQVKSHTAILPFSADDGVSALSFVVFVGYDEESDVITGEFVGFEMLNFCASFRVVRPFLKNKLRKAVPVRKHGEGIACHEEDVDLSVIDEDIKLEPDTAVFLGSLAYALDEIYFIANQVTEEENGRSDERAHGSGRSFMPFSHSPRTAIDEPGMRGELVLS